VNSIYSNNKEKKKLNDKIIKMWIQFIQIIKKKKKLNDKRKVLNR